MDNMSYSHIVRVYPVFTPAVVHETILDKIQRFLRIGYPYRKEKESPTPRGCLPCGRVYAYVPHKLTKNRAKREAQAIQTTARPWALYAGGKEKA